jgi:hypothetical protein
MDGIEYNLQASVQFILVLYSFFEYHSTGLAFIALSKMHTSFCIYITVTKRPSSHGHTLPF